MSYTFIANSGTVNNLNTISKDASLAEQIRGKRWKIEITEEMKKQTVDFLEKAGIEKIQYPQYTKFAVIKTPSSSMKKEMREVMNGFYDGKISKEDIKGFFMEYCSVMHARDEETILNCYESFLNENYEEAVKACFDEGYEIARKEGKSPDRAAYYDAKYYYQSEEIHELLKEAAKEYGEKYGVEVDPEYRDNHIKGEYLIRTRTLNFNSKWDFRASMVERSRMMDFDAVPPEGFHFFYKEGEHLGTEGTVLFIGGKDWTEKLSTPWGMPKGGQHAETYFYLADLFQADKDREPNYKEFNSFLNSLVITRNWGSVTEIKRR